VVIGCSGGDAETHAKFRARFKLDFPLIPDTDFKVLELYGARRMKAFLGKSFVGIVRSTYWIDPEGIIRKIWHSVNPKGHAEEVLAAMDGE
jgi:thioredoxin-dependent peroxiredoxin